MGPPAGVVVRLGRSQGPKGDAGPDALAARKALSVTAVTDPPCRPALPRLGDVESPSGIPERAMCPRRSPR